MVNVYSMFSQFCTLSGVMNPFEFFPMQAESPGHQGVLPGGAGTLVHWGAYVASSMRGSPVLRGRTQVFSGGCGEPGSGFCRPPTWERTRGLGEVTSPGLICMSPDKTTGLKRNSSRPPQEEEQRQVHGKYDPSQKGNERKGEKKPSICTCAERGRCPCPAV